jgi:uncharacterized membrane-anchored protein YitT (DUF2179 family)
VLEWDFASEVDLSDGIEILALLTTRKIGLNVSEVIFGINSFVFYPLLGFLVLVPHYTLSLIFCR